ncbi:adhesin, partial [Roseibium sp. RKSG952]|nr:adhesin [Roseibium sp. RKSG952]
VTIGSVTKTVTPEPDGSWMIPLTPAEAAGLSQGLTTITVRNLDSDGEELSAETVEFVVDTEPPTLAITGFSDGAVMNALEQGTDLTISGTTDAENGQSVMVTLNGETYTATVSDGQWSVTVPASDLAALPDGVTVTATAVVSDAAGNPAVQASSSFDTDFIAPNISLDTVAGGSIDLADVANDLVLTGSTSAEDGQTVTVTFEGQTYTGTASGGSWSVTVPHADLAGLSTGTPAAISVAVSDAAGNPAVPTSVSVPVDLTGPSIAISPLSVGADLNLSESGSDLVINGTTGNVPDGQQVNVSLNGQSYTGTVSGGTWSVTVPTADLGALADGSSFTVTADVTDSDGLAAPQASVGVSTDTSPPTLSIDTYSGGAVLNAAEQGTDLTISGSTSAEDGQTVTVSVNGQTYTGTAAGGAWNVNIPAADLGALSDGSTIAVTADVSDAAGNPATQATGSFDTDFTAPAVAITNLSDGAVMNAAEQGTDLTISGTSDAADGTTITVEIIREDGTVDITGTATVNSGTWTYTAIALGGLQDNETYDVTATVNDAAGNSNSATTSFETDFTAPTISVNPLSVGSVLDVVEKDTDLDISGTTTAEDGQTVTVSLGGQNYTATASGGNWQVTVPASDLDALADGGNFTVTASVEDVAGNPISDATTTLATDFRPILGMNAVGPHNAVSLADAKSSGMTVSGTSSGLSAGQTVDVTLNSVSVGTATVAADGTWNLTVPSSAFSAIDAGDSLDFSAAANVSGGTDPLPVNDQAVAHVPAAYVITEAGRSGNTVTFEIHADPDVDISSGFAITAELGFDPSVVTYDTGSEVENGDFNLFLANPNGGSAISFAGAATSYNDLSQPVVTFTMTVQDPTKPIELTVTTPDGGPTKWQIGTDGADNLTSSNIDDVIRGGDGNDTIDLTGAGRDIVVFEADPAANGTDTIAGFTIGPATDVTDALMFSGLDVSTLRGDGTDVETLGVGDAIGANTGFVGLTTTLTDLDADTIATAIEGLSGAQAGDEIYVLATDGTNSVLIKADYSSPVIANVQTVAQFDGLADLTGLNADNILHTDPTGATA